MIYEDSFKDEGVETWSSFKLRLKIKFLRNTDAVRLHYKDQLVCFVWRNISYLIFSIWTQWGADNILI
jgi:hypothetical protein